MSNRANQHHHKPGVATAAVENMSACNVRKTMAEKRDELEDEEDDFFVEDADNARRPQYEIYPVNERQARLFRAFDVYDAMLNVYNVLETGEEYFFNEIYNSMLHNPLTVARALARLVEAGIAERVTRKSATPTGIDYHRLTGRYRLVANSLNAGRVSGEVCGRKSATRAAIEFNSLAGKLNVQGPKRYDYETAEVIVSGHRVESMPDTQRTGSAAH